MDTRHTLSTAVVGAGPAGLLFALAAREHITIIGKWLRSTGVMHAVSPEAPRSVTSPHLILGVVAAATLGIGCEVDRASTPPDSVTASSTRVARRTARPVRVAAGPNATCTLLDDGAVWCWGDLDIIVGNPRSGPTKIGDVPWAREISVGIDGCAILRKGTVMCGWLGQRAYEVQGVEGATSIAVSDTAARACAVVEEGAVWCWDVSGAGREPVVAKRIEGLANVASVVLGDRGGCAVAGDDRHLRCWQYWDTPVAGSGPVELLAQHHDHSCALVEDTVRCDWGHNLDVFDVSAFGDIAELGAAEGAACGRSVNGVVFCFARSIGMRRRDDPVAGGHALATRVALPRSADLDVAPHHACSVSVAGEIHCWGDDRAGQVSGRGSAVTGPLALEIGGVDQLALGSRRSCVLSGGKLACTEPDAACPDGALADTYAESWHDEPYEQWRHAHVSGSGYGDCVASHRYKVEREAPGAGKAPGKPPVRRGSAQEHTEIVVCLADRSSPETSFRLPEGTLDRAEQFLFDDRFACMRTKVGEVECFALPERDHNTPRALADGLRVDDARVVKPEPVRGLPATRWIERGRGQDDACALTTAGETHCWEHGATPRKLLGDTDNSAGTLALGIGSESICIIERNGRVSCKQGDRAMERVEGIERATSLVVDDRYGCAIDHLARVLCWEFRSSFAREHDPDGARPDRATAITLPGPAADLFAGGGTTCARIRKGGVHCWGRPDGSTGLGEATCHARPIRVELPGAGR